ncbi:TetR/AcrR family transcriptional regulator [Streptomyces sp. R21]|uniref:TetR/AcrR family transcriptional regulator n=1 Tax=Streptomyces sp. R21 TaxID=3238627 RepID=A0AB39P7X5_9ACTN
MTTGSPSRADVNRRRILDVALAELLRDPDASMDQIARAAGVVRRTVYGHFQNREALVGALVDEAVETVAAAHAAGREGVADPAESLARSTLAVWEIADRYRLLVALAQRSVTMQGIRDRLTPVREACVETLRRGLDQGVFESPLPPGALAYVHEQSLFALMEAVNDGLLAAEEAGRSAAVTMLTAAGVPASRATELVAKLSD